MNQTPPPKTRKDSTTVITGIPTHPTQSKATPPLGPLGKIKNAKDLPISVKTPKRQKSSRFHVAERVELEKLPNLKGFFVD
jgi:hypothetical protein